MRFIGKNKSAKFSIHSTCRNLLLLGFLFSLAACGGKTPEEHIEAARVFAQEGNNQAAIVELKNAIQQAPEDAGARFDLGKLYILVRDFESAEKELSRALDLGHPQSEIIPSLAKAYEETGATVALVDLDISGAGLAPDALMETGFRKAVAMVQLEKTDEAKALITELSTVDTSSVYKPLVEALGFVLQENVEQALGLSNTALEQEPENFDVLTFSARLYMMNGQQDQVIELYREMIRLAPQELETKFVLANMLVQTGEMEEAEVLIDELLTFNNQNPLLSQLKAIVSSAQNDFETALERSELSIQNGQNDATTRLVAGFAAYQVGDFEKAVGHLSFVAEFLPDNHPALRILAASQIQAGMGDQTLDVLTRIDNATAADAGLFSRAGLELIRASDTNAAREIIEQAEQISETAEDLTRLGILKLSINDLEGILDLEAALEKAPESAQTITTLASAYIFSQQYDKALELAKDLQTQSPNAIEGYLIQVQAEASQEQFDAAEQTLSQVLSFAPNNEAVLVAKIRIELLQEKLEQALESTNALLGINPDNIIGLSSLFAIKSQTDESDEAKQVIYERLEASPENVQLSLLAARVAFSEEEPQKAVEVLSSIEAEKSAPQQFWTLKGNALIRSNDLDGAEDHYDKWAELFPNQELAVLGQIVVGELQRDFESALEIANGFLAREENLQVSFIRAYLLTMVNDVEGAKQAYSEIDDQYKPLPFLRGVNARIAVLDSRAADAIEDAKAAYESVSNFDNLILLLRVYSLTEQDGLINDLLNDHLENTGEDPRVQMLLAERKFESESSQAITIYEEMIERNPNNFVVLNNLAYLLMEEGELDRAETLAKQAVDLQSENVATVDTLAQILVRKGEVEEAVELYKRVITDDVTNEEIRLNYIESLLLNGESTIAQRQIERSSFTLQVSLDRLEELKTSHSL